MAQTPEIPKVVILSKAQTKDRNSPPKRRIAPKQLELRLDRQCDLSYLATKDITPSDFLSFITADLPRQIVDLRYIPRFDFGGNASKITFELMLKKCEIYLQAPIPFHELNESRFLGNVLAEHIVDVICKMKEESSVIVGPILLLADEARYVRLSARIIGSILTRETGHEWLVHSATRRK
jgi:hypothetical protein